MRFRFSVNAGEHERFAPNAFDNAVGKPFKSNDSEGVLIGYKVSDDGCSVELDCEVPSIVVSDNAIRPGSVSRPEDSSPFGVFAGGLLVETDPSIPLGEIHFRDRSSSGE